MCYFPEWIQNHFNWGGETEISILATHFDLEICVVFMEAGFVLPYSLGSKRCYLLYTGQHYDPLVAAEDEDTPVESEVPLFALGDTSWDPMAVECAG